MVIIYLKFVKFRYLKKKQNSEIRFFGEIYDKKMRYIKKSTFFSFYKENCKIRRFTGGSQAFFQKTPIFDILRIFAELS